MNPTTRSLKPTTLSLPGEPLAPISRGVAVGSTPSSPASVEAVRLSRAEWCLRLGAAACFIGHGAFGVITKSAWLPYFGVVGIHPDVAYTLMPIVGMIDIAAGISMLVSPRPIVLIYMVVWAVWTSLLRPLSGESVFETLERAGNYGVPLALLMVTGIPRTFDTLVSPRRTTTTRISAAWVVRTLEWTTALLLFAHGALQTVVGKPVFAAQYATIGLSARVVPWFGTIEMIAGGAVLLAPIPALLVAVAIWKVLTESLYPLSGAPVWELVERGGSYAAPIALVILAGRSALSRITITWSST